MLIPSIDLLGGRVVQLKQGERLAFATDDLDGWIERFAGFPIVQVIDLDAALGRGENAALVRTICGRRPCQVGGGIRSIDGARAVLDSGAARVIVGSAFFGPGGVDVTRAARFADALGREPLVGAVDSRHGEIVTRGWTAAVPLSPVDAVRALEPFVAAFLHTQVETEGMLNGIDIEAAHTVRRATSRRVIAAGGIRSLDEVDALDRLDIDAVVGMAIYTEVLPLG